MGVDPELFLSLLNNCLELLYFPEPWKEAVVVDLWESGKDDYSQTKSYRTIGLLSVLGRVLERMMVRRIRWHVLPKANRRRAPQRNAEAALYDLVNHLRNGFKHKLLSLGISLDIRGAFDGAWWPAIKYQLADKGCPVYIRRLVDSYLENRRVRVHMLTKSTAELQTKGVYKVRSRVQPFRTCCWTLFWARWKHFR